MTKQCRRTVTPISCGKLYLLKAHDIPKFDWSIRSDLPFILSLVLRMTLDFDWSALNSVALIRFLMSIFGWYRHLWPFPIKSADVLPELTFVLDLVLGARSQLGKSLTNGLGTEIYFFVFLVLTARGFTLQVHWHDCLFVFLRVFLIVFWIICIFKAVKLTVQRPKYDRNVVSNSISFIFVFRINNYQEILVVGCCPESFLPTGFPLHEQRRTYCAGPHKSAKTTTI